MIKLVFCLRPCLRQRFLQIDIIILGACGQAC